MKRFLPLLPCILAVTLVSIVVARGQGTRQAPATSTHTGTEQRRPEPIPAPPPSRGSSAVHVANEHLVAELVVILKETKSADTFLITVKALADFGPRSKPAVAAMLRARSLSRLRCPGFETTRMMPWAAMLQASRGALIPSV